VAALDHADPTIVKADQFVAPMTLTSANQGTDDCVQPRTISTTGENPYPCHGIPRCVWAEFWMLLWSARSKK
jgi:hypothetical protein